MKIKIIINFLIILYLILPSVNFAQTQPIKAPETLEELKEIKLNLEAILKKIWKEEVVPVFQKIWNFIKKLWNSYILPNIKKLWQKITTPFIEEIERRKPKIEKEFQKEKQEMKEEIKTELPKIGKSLWQKFKELIK